MSSTLTTANPPWAVKRVLERLRGDGELRERCEASREALEELVRSEGLSVDPSALRGFWHFDATEEEQQAGRLDPDLQPYRDRLIERQEYVRSLIALPDQADSIYSRWRRRQKARCDLELSSKLNQGLPHITVAIELSSGCSVGCWFCGISAEKFRGSFAWDEPGRELWRGVLEALREVVGAGLGAVSLYWGTDPTDNKDYLKFAEDFHAFTGYLPQTTTARPMRDPEWTRQMIDLRKRLGATGVDRFSLLSTAELHRVHETFSAEDLEHVEFVYHNKGAVGDETMRARAGKAKQRAETSKREIPLNPEQGTIACVSGFLVNMLEKRIRLISPCASNDDWPDGFRVYADAHFDSPEHLREILASWTEEHLSADPLDRPILGFHRAAEYRPLENGFELETLVKTRRLEGASALRIVGDLIHERRWSREQIIDQSLEQGVPLFTLVSILGQLSQLGLLDEDPHSGQG